MFPQVFHDELSSMRLWVSMHVSDHSGFHYRQFLLKELITEFSQTPASSATATSSPQHCSNTAPGSSPHHHSHGQANGELSGAEAAGEERQLSFTSVLQLFHQEMELCSDLIQSFPGHETLWSHRWAGGMFVVGFRSCTDIFFILVLFYNSLTAFSSFSNSVKSSKASVSLLAVKVITQTLLRCS